MYSATSLAEKWGIPLTFETRRVRRVKRHFDELCQDKRFDNPQEYFRTVVFNGCLDIVVSQLRNRFEGMNNVVNIFKVLSPKFLTSAADEEVCNAAIYLPCEYVDDLSSEFPDQVICFRDALKSEISRSKSIYDLSKFLLVENSTIASSVPDLCTAFYLF